MWIEITYKKCVLGNYGDESFRGSNKNIIIISNMEVKHQRMIAMPAVTQEHSLHRTKRRGEISSYLDRPFKNKKKQSGGINFFVFGEYAITIIAKTVG